ncbi:hypothetical protein DOE78_23020 [Bacillus sp. Y1]|nr:glycosyltransferase [Bacillus sp. Y1]AYA78039.1 hypothetical protein DOE78_23020 [Bacillus sp. Y1]
MKKLVLLTSSFPYPPGEDFLTNEVYILAKYFSEIIIVPTNPPPPRVKKKNLPDNVWVLESHFKLTSKPVELLIRISKILADFSTLKWAFREYRIAKKHGLTAVLKMINWLGISNDTKDVLKKYNLEEKDLIFYSYWLTPSATALALMKERMPELKAFSRVHGGDLYLERHNPAYIPFQGIVLRELDQIFSISDNGKEYLEKRYSNIEMKVQVSRLGTVNHLHLPYQRNNREPNKLRLISCSYLKPVKRIHLLVEALKKCDYTIEWTHIGDGPEKDHIEALIKTLPSNIKVYMLGNLNNEDVISNYEMNTYDLFINVSESEGIPVTIMEACSFGIPVLATDVGGLRKL